MSLYDGIVSVYVASLHLASRLDQAHLLYTKNHDTSDTGYDTKLFLVFTACQLPPTHVGRSAAVTRGTRWRASRLSCLSLEATIVLRR